MNLLLFVFQLLFIWEHLPFAATAGTEVGAEGVYTISGREGDIYGLALSEALFVLAEEEGDGIAWDCPFNKDDTAIGEVPNALSFRGIGGYLNVFEGNMFGFGLTGQGLGLLGGWQK